jgi:hypothetical protein
MTTSQEADELLREWQERRRGIAPECREKINDGAAKIQCAEPGITLFIFLVSLRQELRTRAKPLPRYCERDPRSGILWFRVDRCCPRIPTPLPDDPTSPEFHTAYNAALVDAAAAESEFDND